MKYKVGDIITDGKVELIITKIIISNYKTHLNKEFYSKLNKRWYPKGELWHEMAKDEDLLKFKLVIKTKSHLPKWW